MVDTGADALGAIQIKNEKLLAKPRKNPRAGPPLSALSSPRRALRHHAD